MNLTMLKAIGILVLNKPIGLGFYLFAVILNEQRPIGLK